MIFFGTMDSYDNNPLTEALLDYYNMLNRGLYGFFPDEETWTKDDELNLVVRVLEPYCDELNIEGITRANLQTKLKDDLPFGLPKIVHLLVSLHILEQQKKLSTQEELLQLFRTQELSVQVRGNIPSACLAYLGTIRHSSLKHSEKITPITNIILGLLKNIDTFGVLGHIVLKVAVQDWTEIIHALTSTSDYESNPRGKEALLRQTAEYTNKAKDYLSWEETKKKLTIIEKFILRSLEKLNNKIGQINLPELSDQLSSSKEEVSTLVTHSAQFFPTKKNIPCKSELTTQKIMGVLTHK